MAAVNQIRQQVVTGGEIRTKVVDHFVAHLGSGMQTQLCCFKTALRISTLRYILKLACRPCCFQRSLFHSCFPTKTAYSFITSVILAACPTHFLLDFIDIDEATIRYAIFSNLYLLPQD
jgi:hypothetical protein